MCNIFIKFGGRESESGGPEHLIENCFVLVRAPVIRYLQDALVPYQGRWFSTSTSSPSGNGTRSRLNLNQGRGRDLISRLHPIDHETQNGRHAPGIQQRGMEVFHKRAVYACGSIAKAISQ